MVERCECAADDRALLRTEHEDHAQTTRRHPRQVRPVPNILACLDKANGAEKYTDPAQRHQCILPRT